MHMPQIIAHLIRQVEMHLMNEAYLVDYCMIGCIMIED